MLGAILTAPYLLQGSANRAASEMSHRSDHPRKSTCTQVSRNNGRSHGPTRKASNQASNETMKRKPSRTVQTVVYSKDARDRSFYQCKSWSLVPPKTAWLWWSMHAGAARLMGSVYPGSSMEFNRPSSCCATCSKHHVPDLPVSLLFLNDRSRLEPDPGGEIAPARNSVCRSGLTASRLACITFASIKRRPSVTKAKRFACITQSTVELRSRKHYG